MARLLSGNVGLPRDIKWKGRTVHTAIWKDAGRGRCRVGIRMNEPRMPALLTSSGRPGFYFRVLQEGEVGAGDEIVKVAEAKERMTVAEINALLYSPNHARDRLERALQIEALSPGWRSSFELLLQNQTGAGSGNAGLAPAAAAHPVAPGFRP